MHGKGVGLDFAGIVTKVSADVTSVAVGDRVFGNAKTGTLADSAECKASAIATLPPMLSYVEGAALPIAYLTAYQAFSGHGFKEGMKVLVIGASGGCGSAGVQLAKAMGASEIVGVCSQKNETLVKSLGADRIIDYNTHTIVEGGHENYFDFVYDAASYSGGGEDYTEDAQRVVKENSGIVVALNGGLGMWARKLVGMQQKYTNSHLILTQQRGEDLKAILAIMTRSNTGDKELKSEALAFRPIVDKTFPFSEQGTCDAFTALLSRRTKGKIVVNMEESS
jgi:NADPH:quinone reductase-like Zn-dependent oxidoreductase